MCSVYESIVAQLRERVLCASRRCPSETSSPIVLFSGTGNICQRSEDPIERLMYLAACEGISVPNVLAKIVSDIFGAGFVVRYESESFRNCVSRWRFVLIRN